MWKMDGENSPESPDKQRPANCSEPPLTFSAASAGGGGGGSPVQPDESALLPLKVSFWASSANTAGKENKIPDVSGQHAVIRLGGVAAH